MAAPRRVGGGDRHPHGTAPGPRPRIAIVRWGRSSPTATLACTPRRRERPGGGATPARRAAAERLARGPVALLVFLARAAGTGIVPPHVRPVDRRGRRGGRGRKGARPAGPDDPRRCPALRPRVGFPRRLRPLARIRLLVPGAIAVPGGLVHRHVLEDAERVVAPAGRG